MDEPTLFVVRVWRRLPGFRATVREVDSEHTDVFTTSEELVRFLDGAGGGGCETREQRRKEK